MPWDGYGSGREAVQLDFVTCQIAGDPPHMPGKFNGGAQGGDAFGDLGRQNRALSAGVQDQR